MSNPNGGRETALATRPAAQADNAISVSLAEKVLIGGDLAALSPQERLQYYQALCQSYGLNPLSRPFEYIELQKKLTLYATKSCAAQLRDGRHISIYQLDERQQDDLYIVRAYARTPDGRTDIDEGRVFLLKEDGEWKQNQNGKPYFKGNGTFLPLVGEDLANAQLKAVTKAKRRVTLSICGLGFLDETEVDSVKGARRVNVDPATGEIVDTVASTVSGPKQLQQAPRRQSQEDLGLTQRLRDAWQTLREVYEWSDKQINAQYMPAVGGRKRFDMLTLPEKVKAVEQLERIIEGEREREAAQAQTQGEADADRVAAGQDVEQHREEMEADEIPF